MIDDIDAGNCNASKEQLDQAFELVMKLKSESDWLTMEESCRYLGISRPTFQRRVTDGVIPHGVKRSGLKELLWTKSMLDEADKKLNGIIDNG